MKEEERKKKEGKTWKTMTTKSLPMCLFLSTCCSSPGVYGRRVDT